MIAVIDYGTGNLLSVRKAFEAVAGSREVVVTNSPQDLAKASHIVLPGVGSFPVGMANLEKHGLIDVLRSEVLEGGKPFLGICLGMQLLAETGEESGEVKGLGFLPGRVRQLAPGDNPRLHLGWNDIQLNGNGSLLDGTDGTDFYFVHQYVYDAPDEVAVAHCSYGEEFVAAVQQDNIFATQFHPEKSRKAGLDVLRAFLRGKACSKSDWFLSSS